MMMMAITTSLVSVLRSPDALGSDRSRVSDRPVVSPQGTYSDWRSPQLQVHIGSRTRPLRDGGGVPSPGRLTPPFRHWSEVHRKGEQILDLIDGLPTLDIFPCTACPFQEDLLDKIRSVLAPSSARVIDPGQPFYLDIVKDLWTEIQDPDSNFPDDLKEGVPLGVVGPTLRSPGVWPTKDEL